MTCPHDRFEALGWMLMCARCGKIVWFGGSTAVIEAVKTVNEATNE